MLYPQIHVYVKLLSNMLTSSMNMTPTDNCKQADSFKRWLLCLLLNSGWDVTVGWGCWLVWYWCTHTFHWSVSTLWCATWWAVGFCHWVTRCCYMLTAVESCDQVFGVWPGDWHYGRFVCLSTLFRVMSFKVYVGCGLVGLWLEDIVRRYIVSIVICGWLVW